MTAGQTLFGWAHRVKRSRQWQEATDRPQIFVLCYPLWGIALAERFFGQIIANMLRDVSLESVTVKFAPVS